MGTLANSEDPDEMQHNHINAKTKSIFREKVQYFLEIVTYDPLIYTMDHSDFIACSFIENSIGLKRVKE